MKSRQALIILPALVLAGLLLVGPLARGVLADDGSATINGAMGDLGTVVASYRAGNVGAASTILHQMYEERIEPLEVLLGTANGALVAELEGLLADGGEIQRAMASGAPVAQVEALASEARGYLEEARDILVGGTAPAVLFFNSFVVILREGFEAILIVGAMSAYLLVTKNERHLRTLYLWATLAIFASLATWVLVQALIGLEGTNRELLEGITTMLAVAVLFYVSYWVISKIQAQKWQHFIKGRLSGALQRGSSAALGGVAFLAVYREGLETALFYQGVAFTATRSPVPAMMPLGFLGGVGVLACLFLLIYRFGLRVPLKHFFIFTGAVLYYLAFTFTGAGIHEFQEAGVVGTTPVAGMATTAGPVALSTFGLYPTVETLAAQAVVVAALLFGLIASLVVRSEPLGEAREATQEEGGA